MFEEVVEMQSSNFGYVPFAALWLVLITSPVLSSIDRDTNQLDGDLLSALMEYHGISEDQVIERLAHEAEAARLYSEIPGLVGDAYAGAWFDENTLKLTVGLTNPEHVPMVERLGAKTVILEHSLSSLNAIQEQIERMRSGNQASFSGLVGIGIDYRTNQLALDVQSGHRSVTAHALAAMSIDSNYYRVNELSEIPQLSSYIVGAECFENPLFTSWQNGDPYWCSIGFSVQGGFITAGHCGAVNHDVESCIGTTPMGQFKGSTWHSVPQGQRIQDSGWVETNPSWQPLALVNGYAGGMFSVTGEFGGYREVPVGSSVCRYGQASGNIPGAPHCGVVQVRNKTQQFCGGLNAWGGCAFYEHIQNTTETNICVEFGDSGGAFLSGTGHAQGTTIGGHNGTCPSASKAWFQPAGQTLNAFSRTLLTSHGSNPPTIANLNCPDPGNSGNGQYVCQIIYNTQGSTAVSWTSSTGHSSNSDMLFGTCIPNTTVNVDVSVTNNWGITPQSTNFPCPTGSIQ